MSRPRLLLVLSLAWAGCGRQGQLLATDAADGPVQVPADHLDGAPDGPSIDDRSCAPAAELYCQKMFGCRPVEAVFRYRNIDECREVDSQRCRDFLTAPGLTPGGTDRTAHWRQCRETWTAQSCDAFNYAPTPEVCRWPPGPKQNGQNCVAHSECDSAFCLARGGSCPICTPRSPEGTDGCGGESGECAFGLVCHGYRCHKPATEGMACGDVGLPPCENTLTCLASRCARPIPLGGPCVDGGCDWGARCDGGRCQLDNTEGADGSCADRTLCVVDNYYCDRSDSTCKPEKGEGEPCSGGSAFECGSRACVAGICTRRSWPSCGG